MQKIDRLGWAAGISFTAYGRRVGIRVNEAEGVERLERRLPYGWKPAAGPVVERLYSLYLSLHLGGAGARPGVRRFHLLYGGAARVARTEDVEEIYEALETDLRMYIAEAARRRVFVHAGVVGWRGTAIVIPGRSFSGKSTLVRELVRAGATYYSDEYAAFDARGRVHPYLKPLSIRENGASLRQTNYEVEALGGRAGSGPLPVGLIVVSAYKEGARWRPRALSAGLGALELLANTVAVRRQPEKTLATLQQVVERAAVLKGARGEAGEVVESILKQSEAGNSSSGMRG